jgi:type IV pilus assembly protein PilB
MNPLPHNNGTHDYEKIAQELSLTPQVSIVALVDNMIGKAEALGASDIHIDPTQTHLHIRMRVDGVLQSIYNLPKHLHGEITTRIKVLSKLRTDEHQAAQDGRFRYTKNTHTHTDIRVSIVPCYHGETVVLRLLSDKKEKTRLEDLGFSKKDQEKIEQALRKSTGMILSTGPTGSGKTTTLYTLIKMLNSPDVSIVTIEDPIEYAIAGIKQIQVNPRTGLTFANGLRSVLRQDPNIIMVGEIRDTETAGIAVNTALTGHLLLSTLHTNDAATTLPRLLDMGIEPYVVASTVSIAIGQRLVRTICEGCKKEKKIDEYTQGYLDKLSGHTSVHHHTHIYSGTGCELCNHTGYAGRMSVNEVLVADETLRKAIVQKASASEIRTIARSSGMTSFGQDGVLKIYDGLTTLEEIIRITHE